MADMAEDEGYDVEPDDKFPEDHFHTVDIL